MCIRDSPNVEGPNMLNAQVNGITPKEGALILFPSYLTHYVPVNTGGDRYSLSFNTFPSGSFGSKRSLTHVNLEKEV